MSDAPKLSPTRSSRRRRSRSARPRRGTARRDARLRPTRCRARPRASSTSAMALSGVPSVRSTCRAADAASSVACPSSRAMLVTSAANAAARPDDEHGERIGAAARFEEAFAQVQQMAARLYFARAAKIGWIDGERSERVAAGHDRVIGEDRAEFEREGVERLLELVRGDEERRRQARRRATRRRGPRTRADRRPSSNRRWRAYASPAHRGRARRPARRVPRRVHVRAACVRCP